LSRSPVLFVVLARPIGVSRGQISAFRELFEEGISREVQQPLNGRQVLSDTKDDFGCERPR
jgi:carbonic anhydrase